MGEGTHWSFHPVKPTGENNYVYSKDWLVWTSKSLPELGLQICEVAWSPIVWKEGIRSQANFQASCICCLDFDNTLKIEQAYEIFSEFTHIIAPTKSHMLEDKNDHYFRVLLFFSRYIEDLQEYRDNLKFYSQKYNADVKAVDGARFFYPSTCVYNWKKGKYIDIVPTMPKFKPKPQKPEKVISSIENFSAFSEGNRNQSVFIKACELAEAGVTEADAISTLLQKTNLPAAEAERTVKSAYKHVGSTNLTKLI